MIVTLTIPLVKVSLQTLLIHASPNTFIGWVEEKPILMCTIMDANNYNIFLYSVMFQIILFKIILVVSPARFLGMNTINTKFVCLVHLVFCLVFILGYVITYGHKCNGLVFLIVIKEFFKLDVKIQNLNEIEELSVTVKMAPLLFVVFFIELGLQQYVRIKKKIKKKLRNKVSPPNPSLSGPNSSQLNAQNTIKGDKNSSYNYTLIFVTRFIIQVLVFIVIKNSKDVLLKTILSFFLNILTQFGTHIVPVLWILNHEPIKIYVFHKLYKIKVRFIY